MRQGSAGRPGRGPGAGWGASGTAGAAALGTGWVVDLGAFSQRHSGGVILQDAERRLESAEQHEGQHSFSSWDHFTPAEIHCGCKSCSQVAFLPLGVLRN